MFLPFVRPDMNNPSAFAQERIWVCVERRERPSFDPSAIRREKR
jgi:hypothetical protein